MLCSDFLLSYDNRPLQNLPTGGHGHVICMGNMGGVFPNKILKKGAETFVLFDLVLKVQKSHTANR